MSRRLILQQKEISQFIIIIISFNYAKTNIGKGEALEEKYTN